MAKEKMPCDDKGKMPCDDKGKMKKKMKPMAEDMKNWLDVYASSIEEVAKREDVTPADKKAAKKEYGDVEYADEKNKKYPLDAEHIRAAISYWGMPKNRAKYSPEDQKKISAKIARAAKKHGVEMSEGLLEAVISRKAQHYVKHLKGIVEVFADPAMQYPIGTAEQVVMSATDFSKNYEQYTNDEIKAIAKKIADAAKAQTVDLSTAWLELFKIDGSVPDGKGISLPKKDEGNTGLPKI